MIDMIEWKRWEWNKIKRGNKSDYFSLDDLACDVAPTCNILVVKWSKIWKIGEKKVAVKEGGIRETWEVVYMYIYTNI